ncbi:MAG: hypothetical protein LBI60_05330 [Bacteroidales bacterium]|jgi:hypothetical protein|nr:hypothetical protein [Bacteroidales bacterium]
MTDNHDESTFVDFDNMQIINVESATPSDKRLLQFVDFDNLDINRQKSLALERYKQDTDERKLLSHWVIWVVSAWLFFTLLILAFNHPWCLGLSDAVCCMFLGTTTVNILGLAYIVLKGLFPEK